MFGKQWKPWQFMHCSEYSSEWEASTASRYSLDAYKECPACGSSKIKKRKMLTLTETL